jgi:N-carbamoyl-L-amino-acid hydrolase
MIILAVQEIALEQSHLGTVGTVGAMKVHPGAMNVVPGLVEMWVDIRGTNHESIIEALQDIKDAISTIAEGEDTPVAIEVLSSDKPVLMDDHIKGVIEDACRQVGVSYKRMPSGAGHDAMNMAHITAAGMIFIPCRGGISHNPEEFADTEDIVAGVDVLTETLYRLAK